MPATIPAAGGVRLRDALPECQFNGPQDLRATSCCSDPTRCQPGDVFVAICNDEYDGHDYVYDAIDNGAIAVVAERIVPVGVPLCLVPDSREAYGRLCQALVDHPTREMTTIGVTGTHGKTTVAKLLASVLRTAGARVGMMNSTQCCDGIVTYDMPRPSAPPELAHWLAEMQAAGCSHAVVEVDSRDLAQRRTAGLEFDTTIVTNVRRERAYQHNTPKNQQRATDRIFSQLKPEGFAVINADDHVSQQLLAKLDCPTMTAAVHADAEVTATVVERYLSEQTVLLSAGDEIIPLRTRMIGDHHLSNCLLVAATALAMGIDLPTIVRGIEAVETIALRMERIECGQPFGVFLDTADSPDRLAACLQAVRQVTKGRVFCIANADSAGPCEERPLIGRVLEKYAGLGLISSSGFGLEPALQSIHDVLDGYDRPARAHVIPDRTQAIEWALSQAKEGDCILVAGCASDRPLFVDEQAVTESELIRECLSEDSPIDIEQMILRIQGQ